MVDEDFSSPLDGDPVAARVDAFTALLVSLSEVKDVKLRKEGMIMLQTVRRTIKVPPQGVLASVSPRSTGTK